MTAMHQAERQQQHQRGDRAPRQIHERKPQETRALVSHGSMVLPGPGRKASAKLGEEIEPAPSQRSVLAGGLLEETAMREDVTV